MRPLDRAQTQVALNKPKGFFVYLVYFAAISRAPLLSSTKAFPPSALGFLLLANILIPQLRSGGDEVAHQLNARGVLADIELNAL